jgi:hypothetical protein
MENYNQTKGIIKNLGKQIFDISESNYKYETFVIETNKLPLPKEEGNIRTHSVLNLLFQFLLDNKSMPMIYWFEITEGNPIDLRNQYIKYSEKQKNEAKKQVEKDKREYMVVPAFTKTPKNPQSKILYVGKVKKDMYGRIVSHLGYHHSSPDTQGLQIARLTHGLNIKLNLHIVILPAILADLTGYIEHQIANKINPLLGKHSG